MAVSDAADDRRVRRARALKDGATVIMVGVDGSRTSRRAAAYAIGLARRQNARLVAAFVARPPGCGPAAAYPMVAAFDASTAQAEALRCELASEADWARVAMEFMTVTGDAYRELQRIAIDCGAEVVVIGASESRWHRLFGSLPGKLVRCRRFPVIVVP